jgi:hypothetical protein
LGVVAQGLVFASTFVKHKKNEYLRQPSYFEIGHQNQPRMMPATLF